MDNRDPELEFNSKGMKTKQNTKTLVTQGKVAGSVDFSIPGSLLGGRSLLSTATEGDYALEREVGFTP